VTRGQLPQRAGLPGLNGGGAAAAVLPTNDDHTQSDTERLIAYTMATMGIKGFNICMPLFHDLARKTGTQI